MFHAGHLQLEIGVVLEPLYEAVAEYGKLHSIHEVQLSKLSGPDRQAMYQRLAELAEGKLYDQPRAFHWWSEALVEDPRWEHALEESERLANATRAGGDQGNPDPRAPARTADKDAKRPTTVGQAGARQ